jgi:uncharacterized protein
MNDQSMRRPIELEYSTEDRAIFNFFNAVYAWMCVGLVVTAAVGFAVSLKIGLFMNLYGRGGTLAFMLGSLLLCWGIRAAAVRISAAAATALFLLYSAVIGMMLSPIFAIYSPALLGGTFLVTAGTFGATSAYGYLTKRDLTSIGSILFMCLVGLFLATLVNIFLTSTLLGWAITYFGLALFIGLTAYDSQKLKAIAYETQGNGDLAARYAIIGSLMLYLDFVNMFLFLLRIMGSRK